MICRACEDAIADALMHTRGVISAQAHYWRSRVAITYDPDIVTEDTLRQVLTNAGYPPGAHGMGGVVVDGICLALVGVLYWGLPKLLMLVQVPTLDEHASLGLVFLVGLLTSYIDVYAVRVVIDWISIYSRFGNFSYGILDPATLVYYFSICFVFMFLIVRIYEKRRWS